MWYRRVQKQGSSLVIVLPAKAASAMKVSRGDYLAMALGKDMRLTLWKPPKSLKRSDSDAPDKA